MLQKKDTSVITLALLLALAAAPKPSAASLKIDPVLAQSPTASTSLPLPKSVKSGTKVRINGSSSMAIINRALKQRFEKQFPGTQVKIQNRGTTAALKALLSGKIDLAAIGRPLTAKEKAQGLVEIPIARNKIATVVGPKNPFKGSLTDEQFAKIFRGEIRNWSQVGGSPRRIRFIDRPASSDTRQALRNYSVFQKKKFQTGANAVKLSSDSTAAVIGKLGTNGISYAISNQVVNRPGVRVVLMHKVTPDNPRYPFEQPLSYVYNKRTPSAAALAFLGFAKGQPGQQAIKEASAAKVAAATKSTKAKPKATATPKTAPVAAPAGNSVASSGGIPSWLWLLLPLLALLGIPIWWLLKNRPSRLQATENPPQSTPNLTGGDDRGSSPSQVSANLPPATPNLTTEVTPYSAPSNSVENPFQPSGAIATPNLAEGAEKASGAALAAGAAGELLSGGAIEQRCRGAASPGEGQGRGRGKDFPPVTSQESPVKSPFGQASRLSYPVTSPQSPVTSQESRVKSPQSPVKSQESRVPSPQSPVPLISGEDLAQSEVEAAKFDVGQTDLEADFLAAVDEGLPDLPDSYGESRIVLMPRDPQWAYAYWDLPQQQKEELRQQGGTKLALRFYDVTDIDLNYQNPHSVQEYGCDEMARDWYLPVPVSDRDYILEIGYVTNDGRWLILARSNPIRVPPLYPSDWFNDRFVTISWDQDLQNKKFLVLGSPNKRASAAYGNGLHDPIFATSQSAEAQRQHTSQQAVSSYVFPSGVGMWAAPTASSIGMSGIGFSASLPSTRPRNFWLMADAEIVIYGATEPDATITIGGRAIKANSDGTFRFQLSFQDGLLDYPIMAVAADGEQSRSIHLKFARETPVRHTNTKEEAVEEAIEQ